MSKVLDADNLDATAMRTVRKPMPANTNPLVLQEKERVVVDDVAKVIGENLKIRSFSAYDQMLTFHSAIEGIQAAARSDWATIVAAAQAGLNAALNITNVTPYLLCRQDGAKRNLASEQREALKNIAFRLVQAARPKKPIDEDRALCLRAMTYAAIAADRGLVHLVKENFGVVIATLHRESCEVRSEILWTPELTALAQRYRNARIRIP